jgi:hypothetical protein
MINPLIFYGRKYLTLPGDLEAARQGKSESPLNINT